MVDHAERFRLAKREVRLGQVSGLGIGAHFPVGELPKAGVHVAAWPPLHEHFPAPVDDESDEPPLGCRRPLGQGRDGFDLVFLSRCATALQRAAAAERVARPADKRAQFHHRLVEGGGISLSWLLPRHGMFYEVIGEGPNLFEHRLRLGRLFDADHAREHANDVPVDDRFRLVERDAADRAAGVAPHPGQ